MQAFHAGTTYRVLHKCVEDIGKCLLVLAEDAKSDDAALAEGAIEFGDSHGVDERRCEAEGHTLGCA